MTEGLNSQVGSPNAGPLGASDEQGLDGIPLAEVGQGSIEQIVKEEHPVSIDEMFGISTKYWMKLEEGITIQSKPLDNYMRLWISWPAGVVVP